MRWIGFALVFAVGATAGCGGGGLAWNSQAVARMDARFLRDLDFVVGREMARPNDEATCRVNDERRWCEARRDRDSRWEEIRFSTFSGASQRPFYVWVRNRSVGDRTARIRIWIDQRIAVDREVDLVGGELMRVAVVRRNSAGRE